MEKKKYEIFCEVLRRLKREGILDRILLVGSWCTLLYQDYFKDKGVLPTLRTRDMEFLFPIPLRLDKKTDLYELLKDLGFLLDFKGERGVIVFQHPELILEFLAPARGRDSDEPVVIDQLGVNAQPLRFMDALAKDPIQMTFEGVTITLPHPINFALHKLLIAGRRKNREKAEKDRTQAVALLRALDDSGEAAAVRAALAGMPATWRKTIRKELLGRDEEHIWEHISA
ncbi:MAG: GSU2403 family nucleotidyltransferase fold protein [Kiritimatiellia bacterium]|nr:GSU2403 family nucleotidyltransferase fold protein [Kiritimatiellia bacterium]MDP6631772.1 GSU2403 family nucleotidyltransferase fold protein [Kiritimatiellia bacterium]MDP6810474.1 GSU2403 family nucleotidyltransferase fold protein [Kiritimatiellia bacterium]MDP7025008.1 GSU2403 family nucleotidyltransferase fold protein [Kiritimatiellia bacterium]